MTTPPAAPKVAVDTHPQKCPCQQRHDDHVRWLALLLRQGLKVIVAGIDERYGESRKERDRRERVGQAS